ncbi:MAG: methyl-accepting chemotaxis protein [Treponema sp.]|nr:methyl-accepting chemotaxis protein [Treponema sp.]
MKIKYKLSILVIAIVTVIVTGIAILLLREASDISKSLTIKSVEYLANQQATYWKDREDARLLVLRTLAHIMEDYEEMPAEIRRDQFDNMLLYTMTSNPALINIYTVWKPNAIDGMDERYIGRAGSTPTGQYALAYTRETGEILGRATTDIDASMAYFNGPNSHRDRVEQPIPRTINTGDVFLLRLMVPIVNRRTNETVGGVGCLLDISVVEPVVQQTISEYDEIAALTLFTSSGFILGHMVPDRVGKMVRDVETIFGSNIDEAARAIERGQRYQLNTYSPVLRSQVELIIVPFTIGDSDMTWSVMIVTTDDYILAEVRRITLFTIILAVIAIVVMAGIIYLALSGVTKPIIKVTEQLKDIAEGEGDLTQEIHIHSKDEINDLARYFNSTIEKIKKLILNVRKEIDSLSDIGRELAINMAETAAAVNEITANIQSIKTRMLNQSATVTETHATMEQITGNINKLNEHVEEQSSSVAKSSSAIEQMLANIRSVTQTLVNNTENVTVLTGASEVGRTGLKEVSEDIQEIAKESEGLLQINAVMANIAAQTNLLSMNAAIEAAHAGDTGKGFAVVAGEIRKLAENSREQSKTISVVLRKIKTAIDKIAKSTDNVLLKFIDIDSSVKTVADQEENIRNAMEEQSEGSKQVLQAISHVNDTTHVVRDGSVEMLEGAQEVIRESNNLGIATQEIVGGINEIATGANEINDSVHRINELSVRNHENIDLVIQEISRFKVG